MLKTSSVNSSATAFCSSVRLQPSSWSSSLIRSKFESSIILALTSYRGTVISPVSSPPLLLMETAPPSIPRILPSERGDETLIPLPISFKLVVIYSRFCEPSSILILNALGLICLALSLSGSPECISRLFRSSPEFNSLLIYSISPCSLVSLRLLMLVKAFGDLRDPKVSDRCPTLSLAL